MVCCVVLYQTGQLLSTKRHKHACLPDCLPACLIACLPDCLPACFLEEDTINRETTNPK